MRRAWIEISKIESGRQNRLKSPSVRRAWIEMTLDDDYVPKNNKVALREDGVD